MHLNWMFLMLFFIMIFFMFNIFINFNFIKMNFSLKVNLKKKFLSWFPLPFDLFQIDFFLLTTKFYSMYM